MSGIDQPGKGAAKSGGRRIPNELLQKIKSAVNILEVVGEHVVLRKSGANHVGLCPFHSERTPSFSVSEGKQLYHCYGCRKGGDLVSFVMELHGLDFMEAIEELAERARIALPKDWQGPGNPNEDPEARKRREEAQQRLATAFKLNRFVAHYYHQVLGQAPSVQQYLARRGVNDELMRNFYVGHAPAGWESLVNHLNAKKAPLPLAAELGLVRPSTKNDNGYFDLFRNRALFPILDLRGRVAGFGGRALPPAPGAAEESPKYLNSPESFIFHKGKLLFGLFQAQKHIREQNEVILVEGYFDVLALHAAGFQNVVASCGTALTPEHLSLFRRFCDKVTVLFDGDKAGIAATERAMELGLEHGVVIQGAAMPEGLDPDEVLFDQESGKVIADGQERMGAILKDAKPLIDVRLEDAIRFAAQGPEARTQAIKRVGTWLAKFTDPVGREVRAQYVQEKLAIPRSLLDSAMGSSPGTPQPQVRLPTSRPVPAQAPAAAPAAGMPAGSAAGKKNSRQKPAAFVSLERLLLAAWARAGEFSEIFRQGRSSLPPGATLADLFDYPPAQEFVRETAGPLAGEASGDAPGGVQGAIQARLHDSSLDPQVRSTITEALIQSGDQSMEALQNPLSQTDVKRALDRGIARCWARFSQRIKAALADAEAKKDAELQQKLMKEYLDVQRKMKEFTSFYDEA